MSKLGIQIFSATRQGAIQDFIKETHNSKFNRSNLQNDKDTGWVSLYILEYLCCFVLFHTENKFH